MTRCTGALADSLSASRRWPVPALRRMGRGLHRPGRRAAAYASSTAATARLNRL